MLILSSPLAAATPTLDANSGFSVTVGQTLLLTTAQLAASDAESGPDQVFFEIILPAAGGRLTLLGLDLGIGGRFSHQDIVRGDVTYSQDQATTDLDGLALQLVDEDDERSAIFVVTVNIDRVAPSLNLGQSSLSYQEQAPALRIMPNATLTDANSPSLGGGHIAVQVRSGGQIGDVVSISSDDGISITGTQVLVDNQATATIASDGLDGNDLVLDLLAPASPAIAQRLLRQITFAHLGEDPSAQRNLDVVVTDETASSSTANLVITVLQQNDPPQAAVIQGTLIPGLTMPVRIDVRDADDAFVDLQLLSAPSQAEVVDLPSRLVLGGGQTTLNLTMSSRVEAIGRDVLSLALFDSAETTTANLEFFIAPATIGQPWWVSDPPLQAVLGQAMPVTARLVWPGAAPAATDLDWELIGDLPLGTTLSLTPSGDRLSLNVIVGWPDSAAPQWWQGALVVRSRSLGLAAAQPWLIHLTTQPGDG